ncbi:hypothetical protein MUK42_17725 [Musa troglodytarum]|uniref:Uncharacterized protein n=1 Tax=Musa troglodytarum TaxID=320322 RepID=A0A9E7H2F7_9LILI|nr:hypothetical protein MUK42_17725 [Musa troglodytarum]
MEDILRIERSALFLRPSSSSPEHPSGVSGGLCIRPQELLRSRPVAFRIRNPWIDRIKVGSRHRKIFLVCYARERIDARRRTVLEILRNNSKLESLYAKETELGRQHHAGDIQEKNRLARMLDNKKEREDKINQLVAMRKREREFKRKLFFYLKYEEEQLTRLREEVEARKHEEEETQKKEETEKSKAGCSCRKAEAVVLTPLNRLCLLHLLLPRLHRAWGMTPRPPSTEALLLPFYPSLRSPLSSVHVHYVHARVPSPPRLGTETDRRDESENEREERGEGGSRVPILFSSCGVSSLLISFSSSSSSYFVYPAANESDDLSLSAFAFDMERLFFSFWKLAVLYVLILPQSIIMGTKRFSLSQGILISNDSLGISSPKGHRMAQQNQETTPVDPANSPAKRKRGRPRKHDYDNLSHKQRRSLGIQASSSQAYPATSSGHGDQAVPTHANVAACSSLLFQSLPVQTIPTPCTIYGAQSSLVVAGSTVNSSYGIQSALAPANPSPYLGYRPNAAPAHAHLNANSADHSQLIPAQSKSAAASSHGPNDLLGQAVCGTLDGTFDAGYMLTVRVANGGHVLRGLVFDPRLCVPVSAENDIAPLLPMATPNGTPSSVVESHDQTLVSVPIHPVPVPFSVALPLQVREPAAASQTMNPMLVTSSLPQPSRQLNTDKGVPNDSDPQLGLNKVAPNDTDPWLSTNKVAPTDIDDLLAEVQAKTLQTLSKSSVNNANQESSPAASQHVVDDDKQAEDLSADVKEEAFQAFQTTLDVLPEDQCTNLVGFLSREQSMHQVKGSSSNMVEAPGANEGMRLTEESSGSMVEAAGGDQGQHRLEESWQGNTQRLSDETSDEKALLFGEPKSDELNPEAPSCASRINFIGED